MRSAGCNCAACPFAKAGRPHDIVLPVGPTAPEGLLVLGGGPTRDDVRDGEPLSGLAGREMDEVFVEAGIRRDRLFIANAWACLAHEPRKEKEEREAVKCCRPLLWSYVGKLPVTVPVMLAGKWAMLALTGREKKLMAKRGFIDAKWTIGKPLVDDKE